MDSWKVKTRLVQRHWPSRRCHALEQQHEQNREEAQESELAERVHVGEQRRLLDQRVVDAGHRVLRPRSALWTAASTAMRTCSWINSPKATRSSSCATAGFLIPLAMARSSGGRLPGRPGWSCTSINRKNAPFLLFHMLRDAAEDVGPRDWASEG